MLATPWSRSSNTDLQVCRAAGACLRVSGPGGSTHMELAHFFPRTNRNRRICWVSDGMTDRTKKIAKEEEKNAQGKRGRGWTRWCLDAWRPDKTSWPGPAAFLTSPWPNTAGCWSFLVASESPSRAGPDPIHRPRRLLTLRALHGPASLSSEFWLNIYYSITRAPANHLIKVQVKNMFKLSIKTMLEV